MSITTAATEFDAPLLRARPLRRVHKIRAAAPEVGVWAAPLLAAFLPALERNGSLVVHLVGVDCNGMAARLARALAEAAGRHAWCRTRILGTGDGSAGPDLLALHKATGAVPASGVDGILRLAGSNSIPRPADLSALYDAFRRDTALIIVECPSVLEVPDTAILSTAADRTVLVANAERTRVRELERSKALLDAAGVGELSAVLLGERSLPAFLDRLL